MDSKKQLFELWEAIRKSKVEQVEELVKSLVRPFIICSSWSALLFLWCTGRDVPDILLGIGMAITGEYSLERILKRVRAK